MLKNFKGFALGFLTCMLIMASVATAYGATINKAVTIVYDNIKIYIDGVKIEPKDANGNVVEPFIYNGTTYLPVRAVGEAIGKDVKYDADAKSVYLGAYAGEKQKLVDVCPPYEVDIPSELYKTSSGKMFKMSGTEYTDGFTMYCFMDPTYVLFNLEGKYNKISFDLGHVDKTVMENGTLSIYGDDVKIAEYQLSAEKLPENKTIEVKNVKKLKFYYTPDGGLVGTYGIGNIIAE